MDVSKYPLVLLPDGSKHRIVPESDLAILTLTDSPKKQGLNLEDIPQKLRILRIAKGLSQAQLADKVGITQSKLSRLEASSTPIDNELIAKLFDALTS